MNDIILEEYVQMNDTIVEQYVQINDIIVEKYVQNDVTKPSTEHI